jgi:hypothetical protein
MGEFMEKNLTGSRGQLHRLLTQNYIQGGGNTAPINTESLSLRTQKQVEEEEADN